MSKRQSRERMVRFVVGLATLTVVFQACGSDRPSRSAAPTPTSSSTIASSSPAQTLTLRLGTNDPEDAPTAAAINEFAVQVNAVSNGSLQIEPVWRAAGENIDDWDQAVASLAERGQLDLALVPSAAWDALGVSSMRALNAPFLVDTDDLVARIVTGDLAPQLMAGLDQVGITGLALLPEGMRHVFAFGKPLVSPADFKDVTIRAPRSDTVYALFTALGAASDDPTGSAFDEAVANGAFAGAESSYARASGIPGGRPIATGNLTLFPKLNALVANSAAFGKLTASQQAMLRDAAKRTLDFVVSSATSDGELAKQYCASVGSIVTASNADLAAFADAARPVYNELERDDTTKQLIDSIRTLKADATPAPTVAPCDNAADGDPTQNVGVTIPFGTYSKTATTQEATDMGVDPTIAAEALGPSGEARFTFVIEDGRWTEYDYGGPGHTREVGDLGTYTYDDLGRWITVSESGGCARCIVGYEWTFNDGVLTLTMADVPGHADYDAYGRLGRLITEGTFTKE